MCIYVSSMSFHGLMALLFFALDNISWSGGNRVYLSTHLSKSILVAFKFGDLRLRELYISTYWFLCGHKFSTLLVNTKGVQMLNRIVRECPVL